METVKNIVWPVALVGGLGAFIDFLIGKTGQERAKDFLLRWWVRFDDVQWKNFGREEGLFSGRLLDKWFGGNIWNLLRIWRALEFLILCFILTYIKFLLMENHNFIVCDVCEEGFWSVAVSLVTSIAGFCLSVSFTKFITYTMAYLCGIGKIQNLIVFIGAFVLNYFLLLLWYPVTLSVRIALVYILLGGSFVSFDFFHILFVGIIWKSLLNIISSHDYTLSYLREFLISTNNLDSLALILLSLFPSLLRLLLSIVFVGSFLLRPFVMRPVNFVWRRIIESEKPVFTLTFGAVAVVASAIGEAAKHL